MLEVTETTQLEAGWRELARRAQLLRRVAILRTAPRGALNALVERMWSLELEPGEVLYRRGDPADNFYVVESGQLTEQAFGSNATRLIGPGRSVGDVAALGGAFYLATAMAQAHTRLWAVARAEFEVLALSRSETASSAWKHAEIPEPGFRIEVQRLSRFVRGGEQILGDISLVIEPGELVAIVGGSGAGKTTLLEAIAGVRPISAPDHGRITYNGAELSSNLETLRSALGYVPQDDIIHKELSLEATLRYAARLRMPGTPTNGGIDARVRETLDALDLTHRARVRVGALSGGERRRACIGVELLTRPRVCFLDEPTSGLDPSTQAEMMRLLRRLADSGSAVVLTTHAPENIGICDKVLFLTREGKLAFFGEPADALQYFLVDNMCEVYERLADEASPALWAQRFQQSAAGDVATSRRPLSEWTAPRLSDASGRTPVGAVRQWTTLTRRNFEILVRNRMTLAILLGSPVVVVLMFAVLFRPGVFALAHPNPSAALMIIYWISFGGFFFGVSYGLLQIVTEFSIFRRERLVSLGVGPCVLSKLAVLVPFLLVVVVAMLGILRVFGVLPSLSWETYVSLTVTLLLDAVAALAAGLFASAAVADPGQATVALPLICWPQVLFAGALVPVPVMALVGRVMSFMISDRWAFEAMGHAIGLNLLFADGKSPLGPPMLAQYGTTFTQSVWVDWAIMSGFVGVGLAATCWVLTRKTAAGTR